MSRVPCSQSSVIIHHTAPPITSFVVYCMDLCRYLCTLLLHDISVLLLQVIRYINIIVSYCIHFWESSCIVIVTFVYYTVCHCVFHFASMYNIFCVYISS